jgi:hypothetical protein
MQLMEHDQHSLKMDPTVIPDPKFAGRHAHSFKLPLGDSVASVLSILWCINVLKFFDLGERNFFQAIGSCSQQLIGMGI